MSYRASVISKPELLDKGFLGILTELLKARLTTLVLLTTAVGFYLGLGGKMQWMLLLHTLLGTALLAGGAAALNQYLERNFDALMKRTSDRPIPSGRMKPENAALLGGAMAAGGLLHLALLANLLASVIGGLTLVTYLFIYTPLKRRTEWNTLVGAIPGALPPVLGWAAARGEIGMNGWLLFGILFLWQVPHFLAIAWIYRADYGNAGFKMLPVVDATGQRTARHTMHFAVALVAVSVLPALFGLTGTLYIGGALFLGTAFLIVALRFVGQMTLKWARGVFIASIVYLPLLLALAVLDKTQ